VLDGYALNPGDLTWDPLRDFGEVAIYDRTSPDKIVERSQGAEIILTNKALLTEEVIADLPNLKLIVVTATGYNVVDLQAASKRGIAVTNVPAYSTNSVAQFTFALLLELCHHVQAHSDAVHAGEWSSSPDFCFWKHPQIELYGKTLGIVGFGNIGRQVARIACATGMKIVIDKHASYASDVCEFDQMEMPDLLKSADVVSLHAPLTEETRGMINRETLALMKQSAFLLNTSRGPLVVDADLADALNSGQIAGAGLDVLTVEPPTDGNPLLTAKNCLITPHIAWATREARSRLMEVLYKNIASFVSGQPTNVVNQ